MEREIDFSEESDLENLPEKEVKKVSVIGKVSTKPRKGTWIVKIEKLIKCNQCSIFLLNYRHFLDHQLKHGKTNDFMFKCGICEKDFRSRGSLFFHKKTNHEGNTYRCNRCEKIFSDKYYF